MKNLKTYIQFNESSENSVNIYNLSYNQFYYLIDFLESDITIYDTRDFDHYENETSISISDLMDLYIGYGFRTKGYEETKKLKEQYCRINHTTWEKIITEHDKTFEAVKSLKIMLNGKLRPIQKLEYQNNRIALQSGNYAVLTVNLPDIKINSDEAFIDINNCPWAVNDLINGGIIDKTPIRTEKSGYNTYPLYKVLI